MPVSRPVVLISATPTRGNSVGIVHPFIIQSSQSGTMYSGFCSVVVHQISNRLDEDC